MRKTLLFVLTIYLVNLTQNSNAQQWSPITANNMWSLNTGNVGISTTSPSNKLDIAAINGQGIRIGKIGDAGNSNVALGALSAQFNIDFTGYRDYPPTTTDQIGARISALRYNNWATNSAFRQKTGLAFYTNPKAENGGTTDLIERMRITPEGNVGIGCDPGSTNLRVYKADLPTFEVASSVSRFQIGLATCNGCFANGAKTGDAVIRAFGNLILSMPNNNNDGNSYIGINDDANNLWCKFTNNKMLRVNGTVIATKMMVKTDVWADYVFNDDYKLKSLEEIDSYIKINKRLPDVPSTSEVIENGIDVAQMNTILLKKVEELTLLMIEQHKTIDALQIKVNGMQK